MRNCGRSARTSVAPTAAKCSRTSSRVAQASPHSALRAARAAALVLPALAFGLAGCADDSRRDSAPAAASSPKPAPAAPTVAPPPSTAPVVASQPAAAAPPAYDPTGPFELSSLLGIELRAAPFGDRAKLEADLAAARSAAAAAPDDPDKQIWIGRRLGYLWRMNEAIAVYNAAIERWPGYAPLYRHRGHRYISTRRFDLAIHDLTRATVLLRFAGHGKGPPFAATDVEPDGQPNEKGVPLTTLGFNIYYHLGLARYLKGEFLLAGDAYRECLKHTRDLPDNEAAVRYWLYLALRRAGHPLEAKAVLDHVEPGWALLENHAYYKLLLAFKGLSKPEDLLFRPDQNPTDRATFAYGVAAWHLIEGRPADAERIFRQLVTEPMWPSFGQIAAEAELAR